MKIAVVGAGHVGLVTAVTFAHVGHDVAVTDTDAEKLSMLRARECPFFEPGLQDLLTTSLESGRVSVVDTVGEAVDGVEVAFVCVGTPPRASGEANLIAVEKSAQAIAEGATGPLVVVEKSTVPAGTAGRVGAILAKVAPDIGFGVASNPEFLREGSAVQDSLHPERILVGADSPEAFDVMRRLYAPFTDEGVPLVETDVATAELSKHAVNAFLALKVSFINAVARVAESVGADVRDVADLMGSDPRVGRGMLNAGLGFGGSCFHKDLLAFHHLSAQAGYDFRLLPEIIRLNEESVASVAKRVEDALWNPEGKRVALLGLAFKPGTDDIRFAPALELARLLLAKGAAVVGYDPQAGAAAKAEVAELELAADPYEAAAGASCLVLCTEWEEFAGLDMPRLASVMDERSIVDGRNFLDGEAARSAGFTYSGVGHSK